MSPEAKHVSQHSTVAERRTRRRIEEKEEEEEEGKQKEREEGDARRDENAFAYEIKWRIYTVRS